MRLAVRFVSLMSLLILIGLVLTGSFLAFEDIAAVGGVSSSV